MQRVAIAALGLAFGLSIALHACGQSSNGVDPIGNGTTTGVTLNIPATTSAAGSGTTTTTDPNATASGGAGATTAAATPGGATSASSGASGNVIIAPFKQAPSGWLSARGVDPTAGASGAGTQTYGGGTPGNTYAVFSTSTAKGGATYEIFLSDMPLCDDKGILTVQPQANLVILDVNAAGAGTVQVAAYDSSCNAAAGTASITNGSITAATAKKVTGSAALSINGSSVNVTFNAVPCGATQQKQQQQSWCGCGAPVAACPAGN